MIALPVLTVPGIDAAVKTYLAPAIFVRIRDIALSGIMFAIYNSGPGAYSIDTKYFGVPEVNTNINPDAVGLLLRLSLAIPLGIDAVFWYAQYSDICNSPLLIIATLLAGGVSLHYAGIDYAVVYGL